ATTHGARGLRREGLADRQVRDARDEEEQGDHHAAAGSRQETRAVPDVPDVSWVPARYASHEGELGHGRKWGYLYRVPTGGYYGGGRQSDRLVARHGYGEVTARDGGY